MENVSSHPIVLAPGDPRTEQLAWTEVLKYDGSVVYPPHMAGMPSSVGGAFHTSVTMQPGSTYVFAAWVVLRQPNVRPAVTRRYPAGGSEVVTGKELKLALYSASAPELTVHHGAGGRVLATIEPVITFRGPLMYAYWSWCVQRRSVRLTASQWIKAPRPSTIEASGLGTNCRIEQWHVLAGWAGYPVGRLDYVHKGGQ